MIRRSRKHPTSTAGDVFDVAWRVNRRNAALLREYFARNGLA
jgi:hypothetical protein